MTERLNDTRLFYALIRESGHAGFHSHEARRRGVTGNPSQRAKDIVSKGFPLWTARDSRGGRPGSLYWLDGNQPEHAIPVRPNHAARVCEECGESIEHLRGGAKFCDSTCRARHSESPDASTQPVNAHKRSGDAPRITPAPADSTQPVAILRDGDHFTEIPIDPRPCRRCNNTGELECGEPCPACDGEGLISRRRVNSYVEDERQAA